MDNGQLDKNAQSEVKTDIHIGCKTFRYKNTLKMVTGINYHGHSNGDEPYRATKDNLANSVQQRSRTDSTPNQTTLKQRPGPDHITSTGQEVMKGINVSDRESCRRVTDAKRQ